MSNDADRPDNANEQQEIEAKLPGGASIKARGSDILTIGTMVIVLMLAYVLWEHKTDAKEVGRELVGAIKEMTGAQVQMTQAQRESNCLLALPPEQRERSAEFCKRVTR